MRRLIARVLTTLACLGGLAIAVVALPLSVSAAQGPTLASISMNPTVGRVIEIRRHDVRLLRNGIALTTIRRPADPITLPALVSLVHRPSWLTLHRGTASLKAGLYEATGSSLVIDAPAVKQLRLVVGHGVMGTIRGSGAHLRIVGVTVTSWDSATKAAAGLSMSRPYIAYIDGSTVSIKKSRFRNLGRVARGGEGVSLGSGSTTVISRSAFTNGVTGLALNTAKSSVLQSVAASGNTQDGFSVRFGGPARFVDVAANHNLNDGIELDSTGPVTMSGTDSSYNGDNGIDIASTTSPVSMRSGRAFNNSGLGVSIKNSPRVAISGVSIEPNVVAALRSEAAGVGSNLNPYAIVAVVATLSAIACEFIRYARGQGVTSGTWIPDHVTNRR